MSTLIELATYIKDACCMSQWSPYITPFDTTKFSLTNFMCQMYFDRVNEEYLTNLSKNPNLHGQKNLIV